MCNRKSLCPVFPVNATHIQKHMVVTCCCWFFFFFFFFSFVLLKEFCQLMAWRRQNQMLWRIRIFLQVVFRLKEMFSHPLKQNYLEILKWLQKLSELRKLFHSSKILLFSRIALYWLITSVKRGVWTGLSRSTLSFLAVTDDFPLLLLPIP